MNMLMNLFNLLSRKLQLECDNVQSCWDNKWHFDSGRCHQVQRQSEICNDGRYCEYCTTDCQQGACTTTGETLAHCATTGIQVRHWLCL